MDNIEINIPIDSSEVTLKTAGKYCDKNIKVKSPVRTVKGTFTPTENKTDTFTITGVPTDCRFVEIAHITPISEVLQSNMSTVTIPVSHAAWVGGITTRNEPVSVGLFEYQLVKTDGSINYGGAKATVKLNSDGLTFTLSGNGAAFAFEAGVTYEWTAYFFDK